MESSFLVPEKRARNIVGKAKPFRSHLTTHPMKKLHVVNISVPMKAIRSCRRCSCRIRLSFGQSVALQTKQHVQTLTPPTGSPRAYFSKHVTEITKLKCPVAVGHSPQGGVQVTLTYQRVGFRHGVHVHNSHALASMLCATLRKKTRWISLGPIILALAKDCIKTELAAIIPKARTCSS